MPPPPAVARRQAGVFTAAQAAADGMDPRRVRRLVAAGRWQRVAGRGLAAVPAASDQGYPAGHGLRHVPWTPWQLAWAAHLTWPEAVVGYRVAARLHGLPLEGPSPPDRRRGPRPDGESDVHVLLPCRRRPLTRLVPHHVPWVPEDAVQLPGGLPVTSMARTVADCLATLDDDGAWALLAWVVSRELVPRARLTEQLTRRTHRPGTGRLRTVHAASAAGAASPGERRLHVLLRRAGIVGWQAGVTVRDAEGVVGVVDVLFERARVVVEIDGYAAHSGREAFVRDRRRQNRLVGAGYVVLRFTWWDLTQDPDRVIGTVLSVLRSRLEPR